VKKISKKGSGLVFQHPFSVIIVSLIFPGVKKQPLPLTSVRLEEAVDRNGYTLKEFTDQLGLHFTPISRILRNKATMPRK